MQRVCCLLILLLHAFSIYAMEIVTSDKSGGIQDIDDNVLTSLICPRLDRPTRDALRCACKKYSTLVYSQDELNEKYGEACDKKDTNKITHWKNLGGCYFYQEFAKAVKNKKDKFAEWLLDKNKVTLENAFLNNITEAITTSTVDEMKPVIQWLLNTRQSLCPKNQWFFSYNSYYLIYNATKAFVNAHPKVQKFVDMLEEYKQEQRDMEIAIELTTGLAW